MFDLEDHVILLTGGDGFLGTHLRNALNDLGAIVVSTDIKESETSEELDITNANHVEGFGTACHKLYGPFDAIINNAAIGCKGKEVSVEQFSRTLDINIRGTYNCINELEWTLAKNGSIVNVASIYGLLSPDFSIYEGNEELYNASAYGASKAAVIQMTRYYAALLAPKRVNAVSPGGIFQGHADDFSTKYSKRVPLGRMADPKEIVNAILFLASPLSSYITGHNLVVDGGLSVC